MNCGHVHHGEPVPLISPLGEDHCYDCKYKIEEGDLRVKVIYHNRDDLSVLNCCWLCGACYIRSSLHEWSYATIQGAEHYKVETLDRLLGKKPISVCTPEFPLAHAAYWTYKMNSPELGNYAKCALRINRSIRAVSEDVRARSLWWFKRWFLSNAEEVVRDDHEHRDMLYQYISTLYWAEGGCPVFRIVEDSDLVTSLFSTDVGDLRLEEVFLPFPTFCIKFDDPNPLPPHVREQLRKEGLETIEYVVFSLLPTGRENEVQLTVTYADSRDQEGGGYRVSAGYLRPNTKISEIMKVGQEEYGHDTDDITESLIYLAVSFCLYVSTSPGYIAPSGRPYSGRSNKQKKGGAPEREHREWRVGSEIQIPQLRRAARESNTAESWKIRSRFIVRGHWRKQVCGKGRADRKLIWIKPFYKGEEYAEQIQRRYKVS